MSRAHRLAILPLIAGPLLLTGCFNYYEEIRFDENGAGNLSYTFERNKQGLMDKLVAEAQVDNPVEDKEKLESAKPPGLSLVAFTKTDHADGQVVFKGVFNFDNLDAFSSWKGHDEIEQVFGGISLKRVEEEWIFERKIMSLTPKQLELAKTKTMNSKVLLKVTGPGKLVDHNANRVEKDATCVWEFSLADALAGSDGAGTTLKARYSIAKPASPTPYLALGALVLLILVAGIAVLRKRKPEPPAGGEAAEEGIEPTAGE
jgi:hypothetical protein